MTIAHIGHNLPHAEAEVRMASFSDLFFNYDHPEWENAKESHADDPEAMTAGLRADAEDFIGTLASATGYSLDADELVADFIGRL